jgi:hypothetical protein
MTSPSPLERLAGPGNVLAKELADAKEFAGLVRSGLVRLKDAENERCGESCRSVTRCEIGRSTRAHA